MSLPHHRSSNTLAAVLPAPPDPHTATRTPRHLLARNQAHPHCPRARETTCDHVGCDWDHDVCEQELADLGDE